MRAALLVGSNSAALRARHHAPRTTKTLRRHKRLPFYTKRHVPDPPLRRRAVGRILYTAAPVGARSWCHEARQLSIAVKFFVGANANIDDLQYDDIVRVPSWDGQDNVTSKQLHSMRYFSSLCGDSVRDWPSLGYKTDALHARRGRRLPLRCPLSWRNSLKNISEPCPGRLMSKNPSSGR